jgi:hypothetical protein
VGTEDHQFVITQSGFDELTKADSTFTKKFENHTPSQEG